MAFVSIAQEVCQQASQRGQNDESQQVGHSNQGYQVPRVILLKIQYCFSDLLFQRRKIDQQNNITHRMTSKQTVIDHIFIKQLFQHPTFKEHLQRTLSLEKQPRKDRVEMKLDSLVQDLSTLLLTEVSNITEYKYNSMLGEIRTIRQELQKVKELHLSQMTKADYFGKQISEDINFEDEQLFDLPSIKRTINSLQERMKEISLNSSAILDTSELLRESRAKEDFIQERISCEITKIQENFSHQQDSLEELVNKKIEKQQKTINNILQTLNQLHHPLSKTEKNMSLLSSSKSAVKLKTFFGFG